MNREQRRTIQKKTGFSTGEISALEKLVDISKAVQGTPLTIDTLPEGQKVKLNTKRLFALKDFADRPAKWKKFILDNKDKIFTVQHDPRFGDDSALVNLAEDRSEVKWLWHISDLEVVA